MKKFKEILSLIAEAKIEPGGQDAGKLFGPRGKYSPAKAQFIERSATRRSDGKLIIDRMITPDHPGIPQPKRKKKPGG